MEIVAICGSPREKGNTEGGERRLGSVATPGTGSFAFGSTLPKQWKRTVSGLGEHEA